METKESLTIKLKELFKESQMTAATHQKCVALMRKLLDKTSDDLFYEALENVLSIVLCVDFKQRNIHIEKLVEFFALFCSGLRPIGVETENDDEDNFMEHPLLTKIFDYLLSAQQKQIDKVRFRACQMINKILDHMVGKDISTELCDKLEQKLIERLLDPKSVIRLQGVYALHRLQDPSNPDDQIISEFNNLIKSDSFAKVRQLCVEKIAARRDTVQQILTRIRDVDVQVRLAAYKRLAKIPDLLQISNRRTIIHCGFLDTSEKVLNFIETTLIPSWVEHYEDVLSLMKSVRLDADENDIEETTRLVEHILCAYFKTKSLSELSNVLELNENKVLPFEALNWETANYWRIYVQFLRSREEFEEETDKVLPELVHYCRYIRDYYKSWPKDVTTYEFLEQQFIVKQLFTITKTYDFGDPASRQALNTLVWKILEEAVLTADVVEVIVRNLDITIPNPERRSHFVSEIISEIMYPMNEEEAQKIEIDKQYKISNLKVNLQDLSLRQEKAVLNECFQEAGELKIQIQELHEQLLALQREYVETDKVEKRKDIPTIIKYLDIAAGLLLSPQITEINSSIKTLQNDVIQELIMHDNCTVRTKALRCYGLCCIIDKNSAKNGIHIFSTPIFAYQAGDECDTQTLSVCISAAVDLLRLYGTTLMAEPVEDQLSESTDEENVRMFTGGTSLTDLIQGLVDLMDDETPEIQILAGRSLCSLILSERVHSASLISRLVLKWCSPDSEEGNNTETLKQLIGTTLQRIPTLTDHADQLEGAVLLTVKALAHAPRVSPLADVNIDNITKFMLALCRTSPKNEEIQNNLATKICTEILNKPKAKMTVYYVKMLPLLDVPKDSVKVKELIKMCDEIRDELRDKTSTNALTKYIAMLNNSMQEVTAPIPEETEDIEMIEEENCISRNV